MKIPREIPVMTLDNATLFPQALLPLHIFEPRYRQMLSDALHSNRMFSVAGRHLASDPARTCPGRTRGNHSSQAVSNSAHPRDGDASVRQR
jgi:Lon protease-like protein